MNTDRQNLQDSDRRFFTNTDNDSLLNRFQSILKGAKYFDVLVGYFRSSGFKNLYKSLDNCEKIRILVGLSADTSTVSIVEGIKNDLFSNKAEVKENYINSVKQEFEFSEDTHNVEESVSTFISFIKSDRLEIRAFPDKNIHAKVYITRYPEGDRDYGRVVTGSSNFSENGFKANREFNVELKDKPDVMFATERFEALWKQGDDLTQDYLDTIDKYTWLNPNITPYELYLKLLYEYFKEDINLDKETSFMLPDGFLELEYQKQAVATAKKILNGYNGVFLADVVGLGKTYITAMLLQQLSGKKLVLCPPVLQDSWKRAMRDFSVTGWYVESIGKIDKITRDADDYDIVVIDEAHRFRNELTQGYEHLYNICKGKKVILVSATPINNNFNDLLGLIKLFQPAKNSSIPGIVDLEAFFGRLKTRLDKKDRGTPEYLNEISKISMEVRKKILSHLMVRRTRTEIKKYFEKDIKSQGLRFPDFDEPHKIIYKFDPKINKAFEDTIEYIKAFHYYRYTPLLYLNKSTDDLAIQAQKNMGSFMKIILVKRLESSFFAFKKTVSRFIESYEKFIKMFQDGTVYIGERKIFDLLDNDQEEKINELLEKEKVQKFAASDFNEDFLQKLKADLAILTSIQDIWKSIDAEPKLDELIHKLKTDAILRNRKVIIFTESKETSDIVYEGLSKEFPTKVMRYSSDGGDYNSSYLSVEEANKKIKDNFDPNTKKEHQANDIDILITTDVLAEGVNLHRANILLNYDLPWNPTKVLQRVGRVNRVGTDFDKIYVYNCFPTAETNEQIHLEDNIKSKLQAFHNTLGEDAKYLSEEEVVSSHGLFGSTLYNELNSKKSLEGEEEAETELKYLNVIRQIRDTNPSLFEKVKKLPKKCRTATKKEIKPSNTLISFFRKGALRIFVKTSTTGDTEEVDFMTAANLFECDKSSARKSIPSSFFDLLKYNKDFLQQLRQKEEYEADTHADRGNAKFILTEVKFLLKDTSTYTDDEELYLHHLLNALNCGDVAKQTLKNITKELKKSATRLDDKSQILSVFKQMLPLQKIKASTTDLKSLTNPSEVILSEYFYKE